MSAWKSPAAGSAARAVCSVGPKTRSNGCWVSSRAPIRSPEPRAWDRLFSKHRTGYITLKLKDSGEWKAGLWYAPSYASAYGEDQDLYIAEQIAVDEAGSVQSDDDGRPVYLGTGLLIRWSEVDYVEFVDMSGGGDGSSNDGTPP